MLWSPPEGYARARRSGVHFRHGAQYRQGLGGKAWLPGTENGSSVWLEPGVR